MPIKTKNLSEGELLFSATDALRVAANCVDAVKHARTDAALVLPLLHEACDAVRVASSALHSLRERAVGVKPPKLGD